MATVSFTATMKIRDGNPYVDVSAARAARLRPGRSSLPVLVRIDGEPRRKPWRINLMPTGTGAFYLYLHGTVRKASRTGVGDRVRVDLDFDEAYRNGPMHPMPAWFRAALAADPVAKANWGRLIPSRKKEVLRYLSWLKSEAAQQRNLAKAMQALSGRPTRWLARDWIDGR